MSRSNRSIGATRSIKEYSVSRSRHYGSTKGQAIESTNHLWKSARLWNWSRPTKIRSVHTRQIIWKPSKPWTQLSKNTVIYKLKGRSLLRPASTKYAKKYKESRRRKSLWLNVAVVKQENKCTGGKTSQVSDCLLTRTYILIKSNVYIIFKITHCTGFWGFGVLGFWGHLVMSVDST